MRTRAQILGEWLAVLESGQFQQVYGRLVTPVFPQHVDEVVACCGIGALAIALAEDYPVSDFPDAISCVDWLMNNNVHRGGGSKSFERTFVLIANWNDHDRLTLPQIAQRLRDWFDRDGIEYNG